MRHRPRGVVLIIVLWLITVLALVAVALAGYLSTDIRLQRYRLARAQARAWAQTGVWLGLQRLAHDSCSTDEGHDWLGDDWSYVGEDPAQPLAWRVALPLQGDATTLLKGQVTISITDEERRLSTQASDALCQQPELSADDVAVVREETSPHLAVESALNINTANERLLQVLCAAAGRPWLAEQLVAYRWDPDDGASVDQGSRFIRLAPEVETAGAPLSPGIKDALARLLAGPYGGLLGVRSEHFTITVLAEMEHPVIRYRVEAVVRRSAPATPVLREASDVRVDGVSFRVLAWRAD